ncbi:MAG: hypothetical protein Q9190_006462 [Brigantiaea leucoxantha]
MDLGTTSPSSLSVTKHKDLQERYESERYKKKRKRTAKEDTRSLLENKKLRTKQVPASTETLNQSKTKSSSPFHQESCSLYLPLAPISQRHPLSGLCAEHLSPLILTYYSPVRGVILAYSNVKFSVGSQKPSKDDDEPTYALIVDEYASTYVWISVDFLIFRPQKGDTIEGWINLQNEGNIGLVCCNFFNASIERKNLPKNWKWVAVEMEVRSSKRKLKGSERENASTSSAAVEALQRDGTRKSEGHFVDGDGRRVERLICFRVKDTETSRNSGRENSFLSIEGTLSSENSEQSLLEQEVIQQRSRSRRRTRQKGHTIHAMSGALVDRIEEDQDRYSDQIETSND